MTRLVLPTLLSALFLTLGPSIAANAAAPKMDILFPAGGSRGATVNVTVTGAVDPWPVQVWCSRTELQIKVLEEKGKLAITIPAESLPGVAWIRLHNPEGASTLRPFVIGTLPEAEEVEPNNDLTKAQVLPSSSVVVQGKHQAAHDVDVYAITLKAGQTIVADLDGNRTLGAPSDGVLQLVSSQGFVLEQNDDDQGLDPRIAFTVPADGQYYVRTFAFPAQTDSSVNFAGGPSWLYRLTITADRFTDFVLPLAVTRGVAGEVEARGWNLGAEPVKTAIPASDTDEITVLVPQSGNVVTVPTVPFAVLVEQEPNVQAQPNVIPMPVDVSGVVSAPDDADFFRFPAKKGQTLLVKVVARSQGSLIDPVVAILDAAGKQLQRVDDQGDKRDPEFNWNPPADGDYLLTVSDLHGRGGPRFYYHASIAPHTPDYRVTVAADSFVLSIDKPLEIPITVERLSGFKGEIDVNVTGLPDGVTAAAVKSLAEGDTSKLVKLVISGNPAAFSGPLQIIATSIAEPKLIRKPTFKLTPYHADTDQLWLTVIKKP
ncbi:MAG: putative pre-peptidase [Planctomycetaceae bacterium]|nr:putative pre-peptidase [Planctomycetaceae bacterium]